ncbi:Hypothetical predicted protein [Mytilus galloprovincialis]|uniref:Reverse transcriptase domain-containing protein n=1 Tax=Mytilus galloprovincialis TaxID=29158 RepID=A0A8B6BQB1_MYTGA|nr:Hypothetical predicted protein [Mytilus galloprovincialis]
MNWRQEHATDTRKLYEQIMDNPSSELFFKLINRNKSKSKTETSGLEINVRIFASRDPYTEKEVKQAKEYLNTGKSADEHGICAEHLKYAQHTVVPVLTKIFNKILQERKVPVDFKSGILTPVLKKEKNPSLVNSYRGIIVTPVLSKLHEFCILGKLLINSAVLPPRVKWQGEFSDSYNIQQGVRQGGILSTHLYKIFVEDLLKELEENSLGFILGTIYCGAPTCADDVALLSSNPDELQVMLNILQRYANQHQYTIHPTKSKIIHYKSSKNPEPYSWNMSGKLISASEETVHLGIKRTSRKECDINIEDRIKYMQEEPSMR